MLNRKMMQVPVTIYPTRWFSVPALTLETSAVRVITVPEMGAKIVSVFDRIAKREWLLPPRNNHFRPVAYGAPFLDQDMSGWDEMFPTIDSCRYPVPGSYAGAPLPDHGEVWSLAWEHDQQVLNEIRLSVSGRALPYRLSRTIGMMSDRSVRLSYEVVNTGSEPLSAFWAAHPQFAVDETTRIVLPADVSQVISVQVTEELPATEQLCHWTETSAPDGQPIQLDRIRTAETGKHRKMYLPPDNPVPYARLQQSETGAWLNLSWDTSAVPYLGIWVDEGSYNPVPTVALEPSTGFYDNLERACQNQRVMHLLPGIPCRWSLDLELGTGSSSEQFP